MKLVTHLVLLAMLFFVTGCVSTNTTPAENVMTAEEEQSSLEEAVGEDQEAFIPGM